jgi:glycerol transport system permease protein
MSLPLLIPWNVVGTIWQIFGRVDIGLLGYTLEQSGSTTTTPGPVRRLGHADRDGCLALDVAGGASGLCRAAIDPEAYYQAAKIDQASRWACSAISSCPR